MVLYSILSDSTYIDLLRLLLLLMLRLRLRDMLRVRERDRERVGLRDMLLLLLSERSRERPRSGSAESAIVFKRAIGTSTGKGKIHKLSKINTSGSDTKSKLQNCLATVFARLDAVCGYYIARSSGANQRQQG